MAHRFQGGSTVPHEKHRTAGKPIEKLPLPDLLHLHVVQHLGAPAEVVVAKGEHVKKGQVVAKATAFVSAPIHAPTSGEVLEIGPQPHPVLGKGLAVTLKPDGEDAWAEGLPVARDWKAMSKKELLDAIRDAGLVGLGGAGFPTHVKLSPPEGTVIEDLLINGAECEPYLTSDDMVMRTRAKYLADGVGILMAVLGAKRAAVGIENNKPEAVAAVRQAVLGMPNCRVVELPSRYPQGAERSLIKGILDKWLPAGKLPMALGVVVQNSSTAVAVADAVMRGIPLIEKVITVSGECVRDAKNVAAPIGARWRDLLAFCGGIDEDKLSRLVMGGPMMGVAQNSVDLMVVKGTSGLLALSQRETERPPEGPCIRCGLCLQACPMGLTPLAWPLYAEKGMWDEALKAHVLDCVECGACEYGCPAGRRMLQSVKLAKQKAREKLRQAGA